MSYPLPTLMIDPPKCRSCGGFADRRPNVDVCEMCGAKVHDITPAKNFEYSKSCGLVHFMKCPANQSIPAEMRDA